MTDTTEEKTVVATLTEGGKSWRILLPDAGSDQIQTHIQKTGRLYEPEMLADMAGRLKEDDLVLDVGANIGNHSLYLACGVGARVIAFEPNAHLAATLAESAALNGLGRRLRVEAKGVGARDGLASFAVRNPENLGGQSLAVGEGDVTVVALDGQQFRRPVKAIKIDVEGMERAVLDGAARLIKRDQPLIYVEAAGEEEFRAILDFLHPRGYLHAAVFNATPTHLFLPSGAMRPETQILRMTEAAVLADYRMRATTRSHRAALDEINLKYRNVTQIQREERAELVALRARVAEYAAVPAAVPSEACDPKELARVRADLAEARTGLARLADCEAQVARLRPLAESGAQAAADLAAHHQARRQTAVVGTTVVGAAAPAVRKAVHRRELWIVGLTRGPRVLGIGLSPETAAGGGVAALLAAEGFDVLQTDLDQARIAQAEAAHGHHEGLRFRRAAAFEVLDEPPFDTLVLDHATGGALAGSTDPARLLARLLPNLSQGGRLILTLPFAHSPAEGGRGWGLGETAALLAPLGRILRLDLEDGTILAALDRGQPPQTQPAADPARLLALIEAAI